MKNIKCSDCAEYRNEWCEKIIDSPHPDILRDCQYWHERIGANIGEQINMCLHDLNILHDMVAVDRADHWDADWQMDQIEHAKICIERLKGGRRMTSLEILNSTPKERQLWYWRKEIESCHRYMRVYPKGSQDYKHWYERYVSAIKTYNELAGTDLKTQEGEA